VDLLKGKNIMENAELSALTDALSTTLARLPVEEVKTKPEAKAEAAEAVSQAAKKAEKIASAKLIEEMRRNTQGRGEGRIHGKDVDITWKGVRSVGTYNNPLKGKYAGFKLSELPDHYVQWAAHNDKLNGWIKSMFRKELGRRHGRSERFVS
jgi:hypothetical protein